MVEGEFPGLSERAVLLFSRSKCGPRLSEEAAGKLRNRYVMMRTAARQHERDAAKRTSIPITVR